MARNHCAPPKRPKIRLQSELHAIHSVTSRSVCTPPSSVSFCIVRGVQIGQLDLVPALYSAANRRHSPSIPLSEWVPRSRKRIPDPATRSFTVLETNTSLGAPRRELERRCGPRSPLPSRLCGCILLYELPLELRCSKLERHRGSTEHNESRAPLRRISLGSHHPPYRSPVPGKRRVGLVRAHGVDRETLSRPDPRTSRQAP
jgi:hypothetical protein